MSSSIQPAQVNDIANKWDLALRISGHAKAPEEALKSIFTGIIQGLEVITKTKFNILMTDRVWNKISGEKLEILKKTFILEFCNKILGDFSEEETREMLEEHRRTGIIKNITYSTKIVEALVLNKNSETRYARRNCRCSKKRRC